MTKQAVRLPGRGVGKRSRARLRSLQQRAQAWSTRLKRAATLSVCAVAICGSQPAFAQLGQVGQTGMAPAAGVVNRAVQGLQLLDESGPGWMYMGINAADRGLGYIGSYYTLGGFIPYAEDDLGGIWSADLRSHLSNFGGFFSNVGVVRKQYLGGTIGGIGVYWDYDADLNQYPTGGACGTTQFGQFGHIYNQVGVSGEWLTDYGNLRSNGYIPVGPAAYTAGNPGSPFYQNYVMSQYGLDAALAGADLEVGAYVPGLADWAGMVSVGGYTFGQARYNWSGGSKVGKDVVPYFGGVYTRLDLTLMRNWDFSLQANNDSFFDWTGFARLTYRMGGSRRRNVPEQMEQPMMRNEHIVRAHQTPQVATNAATGQAWRVIHVDNTAASGGTGTAESPFATLAAGNAAATNPWDIVFVATGDGTSTGYDTTYAFTAPNQSLVGGGSPFYLPTECYGPINIGSSKVGTLPLLSNPAGASVVIDGAVAGGATVANLQITGSQIGIYGTGDLTSAAGLPTTVSNVSITGSGTGAQEQGLYLENASGTINLTETSIANMTKGGVVVDGGSANVNYQGSITNDSSKATIPAGYLVAIQDTTGGTINLAVGGAPASSTVQNAITDTGGSGLLIQGNASATTINMGNVTLTDNVRTAIAVYDDQATTSITAAAGNGIEKSTSGAAIEIQGLDPAKNCSPIFSWTGPITNSGPAGGAASYLLDIERTKNATISVSGGPIVDTGNGIQVIANQGLNLTVGTASDGATITSQGGTGILVDGNAAPGDLIFRNILINGASTAGVLVNDTSSSVLFSNLSINLSSQTAAGFVADNNSGILAVTGGSIQTASTTQPAVSLNDSPQTQMNFTSIISAVAHQTAPPVPPPAAPAMSFTGSTAGNFTVLPTFIVGGVSGTIDDVYDTTGGALTITLPP
jgi:hypothetical protein